MKPHIAKSQNGSPLFDPIFICSQPRSGSTLVQRLINSTQKAVIYGEHLGLLKGVADSYHNFCQNEQYGEFCTSKVDPQFHSRTLKLLINPKLFPALVNGLSVEGVRRAHRIFVEKFVNSCKCRQRWGFKEVRYCDGRDFVMPFLLSLYPNAQFVFTVRNPIQAVSSVLHCKWWNRTPEQAAQFWLDQATCMSQYSRKFPDNCMLVRYEDVISNDGKAVRELFAWLKLPYLKRQSMILFHMEKTGATPPAKGLSKTLATDIARWCSLPEALQLYPDPLRGD